MLIDNGKSLVPFWLVAAAGRPSEEVRLDSGATVRSRSRPGAPTVWMRQASSPIAAIRHACSGAEAKCRCASLVIA